MTRPTLSQRRAFTFFHTHAGCVVGRSAIGAWSLVKAEETAANLGWTATWEADHVDNGPRDWGWSAQDIVRWDRTDHEQEACILRDEDGTVIASLSGIWDADRHYRRVVEAELADEALARREREAA